MEPLSTNFRAPLGYSIPTLAYGTELCEEFPQCCIPGIDYRHFYDELKCPRVLMNVSVHYCVYLYVCVHVSMPIPYVNEQCVCAYCVSVGVCLFHVHTFPCHVRASMCTVCMHMWTLYVCMHACVRVVHCCVCTVWRMFVCVHVCVCLVYA